MLNTTSKIPPCMCPFCGYRHEAATALEGGDRPCPGAISLCMMCGELSIFDDTKRTRKPSEKELADIQCSRNWPPIEQVSRAIKQFRAMTPEERARAVGKDKP